MLISPKREKEKNYVCSIIPCINKGEGVTLGLGTV